MPGRIQLAYEHCPKPLLVATFDGAVRRLVPDYDPKLLKALITPNGKKANPIPGYHQQLSVGVLRRKARSEFKREFNSPGSAFVAGQS